MPGPDAVLVNAETCRLIRQSLDQLEDPCREIIELRYYGELSYSEIATELRLNPKTVSSRLSKCLDRLCGSRKKFFRQKIHLPSNLLQSCRRNRKNQLKSCWKLRPSPSGRVRGRPENAESDAGTAAS